MLIAATAITHHRAFVTRNKADYHDVICRDDLTAEERAFSVEHDSSHLHAGKRDSFFQAVFRILFTRPPTG